MFSRRHLNQSLRSFLALLMIFLMAVSMSGCSKNEEPEPEEAEEPEVEEDISIYADPSLGIASTAGNGLRDWRTILIAGIDNGHRADIQLVLSINKDTGEARMFTVTRDTYMQIADGKTRVIDDREYEFCKCNRAFETGDKYDLMKELNQHLDLNIKEFIGVDWECAATLVDALGGVEVEIESQEMLDAINRTLAGLTDVYAEPIAGTGKQTLTGWQAVQYLRVRKYKGGNPRIRETHSREFLSALYGRAKEMSAEEISEVYDEVADMLDTNMSRGTLTDTLLALKDADINDNGGFPYDYVKLWDPDEHFKYLVPDTLLSNVVQLHANVYDQFDYLPSEKVQELDERIKDLRENHLIKK